MIELVDRLRVVAHALAPLGSRLGGAARLGVADRVDDGVDGVLESVAVGRDDPGVRRGPQRRDGPRGVQLVAPPESVEDALRLRAVRVEAALLGPAAGPLLDRRLEEDLEVGIGQHDGPDVAAGHHDAAARGELALPLEQREAQLRDRRDRRDGGVDRRVVDIVGVVDAVDQDAGEPALGVRRQLDLVGEPAHRVRVRRGHAAGQGQPGHGAVEQARVAEAVADLERRGGADAALARRPRPVEGDDELRRGVLSIPGG